MDFRKKKFFFGPLGPPPPSWIRFGYASPRVWIRIQKGSILKKRIQDLSYSYLKIYLTSIQDILTRFCDDSIFSKTSP